MAERARVFAAVEQRAAAEPALAAGRLKATQNALPDRYAFDPVADGDDRPDVLVADREPRLDPHATVEDVQVRPADPARLDANYRVGRLDQLGLGDVADLDHARRLERDCAHRAAYSRAPASPAVAPPVRCRGWRSPGKHVVVTGGAGGIGRALVEAFADAGARSVVLSDLQTASAADVLARTGALAIDADVSTEAGARSA